MLPTVHVVVVAHCSCCCCSCFCCYSKMHWQSDETRTIKKDESEKRNQINMKICFYATQWQPSAPMVREGGCGGALPCAKYSDDDDVDDCDLSRSAAAVGSC